MPGESKDKDKKSSSTHKEKEPSSSAKDKDEKKARAVPFEGSRRSFSERDSYNNSVEARAEVQGKDSTQQ